MKIEIIKPENKIIISAGQVYKHLIDGDLYLVAAGHGGFDLVNLRNSLHYAGSPGAGMAGNEYVFEFLGMLQVTL